MIFLPVLIVILVLIAVSCIKIVPQASFQGPLH